MRLTQGLCRALQVKPLGLATIDGQRRRTWQVVYDRVTRLSQALRTLGMRPGDRVAVLAHNCDAFYDTFFAILWSGGVIVPLNTRLAPAELQFQIEDADARIILFGAEFAAVAAGLDIALHNARLFLALDGAVPPASQDIETLIANHAPAPEIVPCDSDLAGIFYTGGTTGVPKGVMLSHQNFSAMAMNLIMATKIDETCVILHAAPMFHVADIATFMTTMVAGTHVFARRLDEDSILQLIETHRITHMFTVPAVIDRMAKHPRAAEADLSSLKLLGYGGSPMPAGSFDAARARFPDLDIVQGYGSTEMGAHTFLAASYHRKGGNTEKLKSAGQACFGYELRIVDEQGNDLPPRQVGEIVGRGDNIMRGYWNREEETARALRNGWFYTQDAGYMDEDGFVYITDRLKDMIVTGGENVYSIELESVISRHPAVSECTVIGIPDEKWGESIHAIAVLFPGQQLDVGSLRTHCRAFIAGYKCPKSLEIRTDPLPRSAVGKVLKRELREPYWQGRERKI
jgi:long-chain acyl-CoA synthetase